MIAIKEDVATGKVGEVRPLDDEQVDASTASARGMDVLLLAFQIHGRLTALLAPECRPLGVTPNEALALMALAREPLPVSGIGRIVGIRPNGASVLVDRLDGRGLVRRTRSRRDNRVVSVELTEAGVALAATLVEKASAQLRSGLAPASAAEQQMLVEILQRLVHP
jgi:DNA-binding MarR family transcriptional regulator